MKCAVRVTLAALAIFGGLFAPEAPSRTGGWTTEAQAIIGRPLTPLSYAGVARRTTRRAWYGGAAYGAYAAPVYGAPVYAPPVYVPPPPAAYYPPGACVYDAYGQLVCR